MKLDYTLESPEERKQLVEQILAETPNPSPKYLESLADYLVLCMEKQEKKERKILTENRLSTVTKYETSFEGLASQFENGEDGIYNLIKEDKNALLCPKISITKKNLEEIPYLAQIKEAINIWKEKLKTASGRDAFIIKRAIISLQKDQYLIKIAYTKPVIPTKLTRSKHYIPLDDNLVTLTDPKVCEAVLVNYSRLKQDSWDRFDEDTWYLIYDFETVCDAALLPHPELMRLLEMKIDGYTNAEIQAELDKEFGKTYTVEYISSLWRNKIPKLIAAAAVDRELDWYYLNVEKGKYKKCSRCGQIKLAHPKYFAKNSTSKDHFYSICKQCKNKRKDG